MRLLRRYVAREITVASAFVLVGLILLFAFFDTIQQLRDLGHGTYRIADIALHVLLSAPNHVYEIFPIAALIGTLFALGQFVASSEYVVMRTSGVSLLRLNASVAGLGLLFAAFIFVIGEFVGPPAAQWAHRLRSQAISGVIAQEFRSGLWLKDGRNFVNVGEITPDGELRKVRIYEFDAELRLNILRLAEQGRYMGNSVWKLSQVSETSIRAQGASVRKTAEVEWTSVLEPGLLAMLVVQPDQMSASNLYSYTQFLKSNRQKALRFEVALWAKIMNPLAVVVLMILAVPFASFQLRQGGIGARIVTGIVLGLAFHTMNALSGTLTVLYEWNPVASAMAPTLMFLTLALALMRRQERR